MILAFTFWSLQMIKMRAILEQENWNELDVPDEYQFIVTSLFCLESVASEHMDEPSGGLPASNGEVVLHSDTSRMGDVGMSNLVEQAAQNAYVEISGDGNRQLRSAESNTADNDNSIAQSSDANRRERGKSSCRTLSFKGLQYHMVNWLVMNFNVSHFASLALHVPFQFNVLIF